MFLDRLFESDSSVYVTWDVLHSFARIATNPGVFSDPLSPPEARKDVQSIIDHPRVTLLAPSNDSWLILARLMNDLHLRGNLIPDGVIASILEAHGVRTIYTNDRDFWKFPSLKPVDPFAKR